jgi:hypothetical protein
VKTLEESKVFADNIREGLIKEEARRSRERMAHLSSRILVVVTAMLVSTAVVFADWDIGDPALYYQLPAAKGWDVYSEWGTGPLASEGYGAADDWTAATTSTISDIHFWGSWKNDVVGQTGRILIQIFSNDTSNPSFHRPDDLLWSTVITTNEYTGRLWSASPTKDQGWYDPRGTDTWAANEHKKVYQYNIDTIENPFQQQAGQTYWMMISMDYQGCDWGWKTTNNVSGNGSVFWDSYNVWGPHDCWHRHPEIDWKWTQLKTPQGYCDPRTPVDLAFVLTPEPATLFLLAAGAVAALRRRSR